MGGWKSLLTTFENLPRRLFVCLFIYYVPSLFTCYYTVMNSVGTWAINLKVGWIFSLSLASSAISRLGGLIIKLNKSEILSKANIFY